MFYFLQQDDTTGSDYQYNGDLYEIYHSVVQKQEQEKAAERISKISSKYRPSITRGFDINHFRLIRSLGQGMNGSVR